MQLITVCPRLPGALFRVTKSVTLKSTACNADGYKWRNPGNISLSWCSSLTLIPHISFLAKSCLFFPFFNFAKIQPFFSLPSTKTLNYAVVVSCVDSLHPCAINFLLSPLNPLISFQTSAAKIIHQLSLLRPCDTTFPFPTLASSFFLDQA